MLEQRSTSAQQHHTSVQHGSLRHCSSVAARKSIFSEHAAQHQSKMAANPFSGGFGGVRPAPLSKTDPGYGKPVAGSKSERRGLQAAARINAEVAVLCDMIYQEGERYSDGTAAITFGDLFQIYTRISNKVVGILLRARKHGFVTFEGEVLFQGRDDKEPVLLLQPISAIRNELARDTEFVVGVCHRAKEGDTTAGEGGKPHTDKERAVGSDTEGAIGGNTSVDGAGDASVSGAGDSTVSAAGDSTVGGAGTSTASCTKAVTPEDTG